jgi:anti-sigma B factor antagonist
MTFKVATRQKALGAFLIEPQGMLDSNTYHVLNREIDAIIDKATQIIAFDLKNLNYISSAGIQVFIRTTKAMKQKNGKVVFLNLQPQIKKVFEIINALPSMEIFMSTEELDEYLDVMQRKVIDGQE